MKGWNSRHPPHDSLLLGIEGGGTRTVAILSRGGNETLRRLETAPANLRLLTDLQLQDLLKDIGEQLPMPDAVGLAFAGCRTAADRARVTSIAGRIWKGIPMAATHDLESAWLAAWTEEPARP